MIVAFIGVLLVAAGIGQGVWEAIAAGAFLMVAGAALDCSR